MMNSIVAVLLLAAPDPNVEQVTAAIAQTGCPKLYGMLSDSFQKAAPPQTWPAWCASVGALTSLEPLGTKEGWQQFKAKAPSGPTLFEIAFNSLGKVSGIRASKLEPAPDAKDASLSLDEKLFQVKEKYGLPGLAALVVRNGKGTTLSSV